MKRLTIFSVLFLTVAMTVCASCSNDNETTEAHKAANSFTGKRTLVAYFSATGNTQAVAERIVELTGADVYRIEAADPYATNPYDDSNRIQNEAYNDLRPAVANLPEADVIAQYDTIFVGSPTWWHQPAMVVCTFLESYDLSGKVVIPFLTYGATTYLNESMHKLFKCTPNSIHIPETLPEDLTPDDITTAGPSDDAGIDQPGNARGTEAWLRRIGVLPDPTAINSVKMNSSNANAVYDLQGRRLTAITHSGVYIVGGTKRIQKNVLTFSFQRLPTLSFVGIHLFHCVAKHHGGHLVNMGFEKALQRFLSTLVVLVHLTQHPSSRLVEQVVASVEQRLGSLHKPLIITLSGVHPC